MYSSKDHRAARLLLLFMALALVCAASALDHHDIAASQNSTAIEKKQNTTKYTTSMGELLRIEEKDIAASQNSTAIEKMHNSTKFTQNGTFDKLAGDPDEVKKLKHLLELNKACFTQDKINSQVLNDDYDVTKKWCPKTFDGISCWDKTPASSIAFQRCPNFIRGYDSRRFAYKRCLEDGTWDVNPESHKAWTNYTTCVDLEDLNFRIMVNNIYISGYSISIFALIISMAIFIFFRSLQCTRIYVHMHLFTSFILNHISWIVWYFVVIIDVNVIMANKIWCQLLHIITTYLMVTNYYWMFNESLNLHIALVYVFIKEELAMKWFIAIGWGFSLITVAIYALVRYHSPDGTQRCWMESHDSFKVIKYPVLISLLVSLGFLANMMRVLYSKLRPVPNESIFMRMKKGARAFFILIPLFGAHFFFLAMRPRHDSPDEKVYQVISALLTSLQGLVVAILFCFTNHEVAAAFKAYIARLRRINEAIAMSGLTGAESINQRDHINNEGIV